MDYVSIMDGLLISLSGTTIVLAILTVVVFLLEGLGRFINRFEKPTATPPLVPAVATPTSAPVASLPITDEERVIVALVAGIAAEESDPQGNYHIGSITRTR